MMANVVTALGLTSGVLAAAIGPSWWGVLFILMSLFYDLLDGRVARMEGPTEFGYWWDWSCDVAISYSLAYIWLGPAMPVAAAALAYTQSLALTLKTRFSGRALITAAAVGAWVVQ
jgi:phosphatidylglycerophosphate synthase